MKSCLPGVCTVLDVMVGIEVGKIRWDQIMQELEGQKEEFGVSVEDHIEV